MKQKKIFTLIFIIFALTHCHLFANDTTFTESICQNGVDDTWDYLGEISGCDVTQERSLGYTSLHIYVKIIGRTKHYRVKVDDKIFPVAKNPLYKSENSRYKKIARYEFKASKYYFNL